MQLFCSTEIELAWREFLLEMQRWRNVKNVTSSKRFRTGIPAHSSQEYNVNIKRVPGKKIIPQKAHVWDNFMEVNINERRNYGSWTNTKYNFSLSL